MGALSVRLSITWSCVHDDRENARARTTVNVEAAGAAVISLPRDFVFIGPGFAVLPLVGL